MHVSCIYIYMYGEAQHPIQKDLFYWHLGLASILQLNYFTQASANITNNQFFLFVKTKKEYRSQQMLPLQNSDRLAS